LLIVVDLSDPAWSEQLRTVHAILDSLARQAPRQVIPANQTRYRCPAIELETRRGDQPGMFFFRFRHRQDWIAPPAGVVLLLRLKQKDLI